VDRGERHPTLTRVASGIEQIDTVMAGEPEFNAVYLVAADRPALIESGPAADAPLVIEALERFGLGPDDLAHIVVTHVHLDHAGGTGSLLQRFPRATVWVHERGAPHLADPARLIASTARTYGEDRMRSFYGETLPVPAERIEAVEDGDRINLGGRGLEVLYTPGHASHHVSFIDDASGAVFTGDATGSHLPWANCYRPSLPAPEVDLDQALASIDRIRDSGGTCLLTSHFGAVANVDVGCDMGAQRIRAWGETARRILAEDEDAGIDEVTRALHREAAEEFLLDSGRPIDLARCNVIGSIEMNAAGLTRYWRKRWEAEAVDR
jgi:glyoxylase-like metal-dependent hydrolase (beta-lactamase superfamily II)